MESWNLTCDSIMRMPSSRRVRMVLKKVDLEQERAKQREMESARIKSAGRRRR